MNSSTIIVTPDSSRELAYGLTRDKEKVLIVEPDKEYEFDGIKFKTTYAYNKEKLFYRVRVGPYTTKSEAEYWKNKILQIEQFKDSKAYITDTSAAK